METEKQFLTRTELAQFLTSKGYPMQRARSTSCASLLAAMVRLWPSVGLVALSTSRRWH